MRWLLQLKNLAQIIGPPETMSSSPVLIYERFQLSWSTAHACLQMGALSRSKVSFSFLYMDSRRSFMIKVRPSSSSLFHWLYDRRGGPKHDAPLAMRLPFCNCRGLIRGLAGRVLRALVKIHSLDCICFGWDKTKKGLEIWCPPPSITLPLSCLHHWYS